MNNITIQESCLYRDVVYYKISITTKSKAWSVFRRFSQFKKLQNFLKNGSKSNLPPFPKRIPKFIIDPLDTQFIEQRRTILENFLREIQKNEHLLQNEHFIQFLNTNSFDVKFPNLIEDSLSSTKEILNKIVDTNREITMVTIKQTLKLHDRTVYQLNVSNKFKKIFKNWTLLKSFTDFEILHEKLLVTTFIPELLPELPSKYLFNKDNRKILLELYLQQLISIPSMWNNQHVLKFFMVF